MHNVSKSHTSDILRDIFKYKALVIGAPTYNNKLFPDVEKLVLALQNRGLKNRVFGYFGGFTWAGAAVKELKEFAEKMSFDVVGEPVEMKQALNTDVVEQAMLLAKAIADKLNEESE